MNISSILLFGIMILLLTVLILTIAFLGLVLYVMLLLLGFVKCDEEYYGRSFWEFTRKNLFNKKKRQEKCSLQEGLDKNLQKGQEHKKQDLKSQDQNAQVQNLNRQMLRNFYYENQQQRRSGSATQYDGERNRAQKEEKDVSENKESLDFENCYIRIQIINAKSINQLGETIEFIESPKGKLVIKVKKKQVCYVFPTEKYINERDVKGSALEKCFSMDRQIMQGILYEILEVKRPCLMKMQGDSYSILEKGELKISEGKYTI